MADTLGLIFIGALMLILFYGEGFFDRWSEHRQEMKKLEIELESLRHGGLGDLTQEK